MSKAIQIRLQDSDSKVYRWSIRREPRAYNCGGNIPYGKGRYISGWIFADHDGYERFVEGTWLDLVPRVKATAENYGLTLTSELS